MQERSAGVKRLLRAIQDNADDSGLRVLSKVLNYHMPQLVEDIQAIRLVEVVDKEDTDS